MTSARLIHGFAFLFLTTSVCPASADTIYYADLFNPDPSYGSIRLLTIGQKEPQPIVDTGGGLRALDVDMEAGKIYWCNSDMPAILRANLDGTEVEVLVTTSLQFPSAIAVDPQGGKMYWGDQLSNELRRANLDGSNIQLLRNTAFHRGIALDTVNGKVYWSTSDSMFKGQILRCNLDGPGLETVITSADPEFKPNAIALDMAGGKIYWTDYVVDCVRRGSLDGTNIQTLYQAPGNFNSRGITLDLQNKRLYWGQDLDFSEPIGAIMSMGLDGALPKTELSGTGLANYLRFVPEGSTCAADIAPVGGDGNVNVNDLLLVINSWGLCSAPCTSDLNADGTVNVGDLLAVINAWGSCP